MGDLSEKQLYHQELEETTKYMMSETFFWGEDLIDYKLVIYKKKISHLTKYNDIKENLIDAYLLYLDFSHTNFIKFMPVRYDTTTDTLYLNEQNFNICWKYLQRSIQLGINIRIADKRLSYHFEPTDILDLSELCTEHSIAYISNYKICYRSYLPEEQDKLERQKRSILDNQQYSFILEDGRILHDKKCPLLNQVAADKITGLKFFDMTASLCPQCQWESLLSCACGSKEQVAQCKKYLQHHQFFLYDIKDAIENHQLHLKKIKNGIEVTYNEDTWQILNKENIYELWHNNYVITAVETRYITSGFHNQHVESTNPKTLWTYLTNYSWQEHLANAKNKSLIRT